MAFDDGEAPDAEEEKSDLAPLFPPPRRSSALRRPSETKTSTAGKVSGAMEWVNLGMMVIWAFFLVLILAAMYRLVRRPRPDRRGLAESEPESPLEILQKRFARGEINREEFQGRKKELEQKS